MSTVTTNYNLVKPAYTDDADIADINGNMDVIDAQMKSNADGITNLSSAKQDKTDNSLTTTSKLVVGAINEVNSSKQNITDNSLTTTNKTVVGAINELESRFEVIGGSSQFPASEVGAQEVAVSFGRTLPSVPVSVVITSIGDANSSTMTYIGKPCVKSGSITTTGFTAIVYRANGSYSFNFNWLAVY